MSVERDTMDVMQVVAEAYGARLDEIVKGYEAAMTGLPAAALDWSPGPEMNSIAVLVTHAAAALRYLVGDVVAGDPSGRVREAEFRTIAVDSMVLQQRMADAAAYARGVVRGLTLLELGETRFSPQHNQHYTVIWCLIRALDHLAEHMAHAQLTRMLWEQQAKPV